MGPRTTRTDVRQILVRRDFAALDAWAASARSPQRKLMSLAFDPDELCRWRAIEAYARITARLDDDDRIRVTVRRILWLMNDESGGLAWYGPEMIAEILVRVPHLLPEFAELLPAYLHEEPFERGSHYLIYRLSGVDRELFRAAAAELTTSLADPDPATRAWAAGALRNMGIPFDVATLARDRAFFMSYDWSTGRLQPTTVGGFLRAA